MIRVAKTARAVGGWAVASQAQARLVGGGMLPETWPIAIPVAHHERETRN